MNILNDPGFELSTSDFWEGSVEPTLGLSLRSADPKTGAYSWKLAPRQRARFPAFSPKADADQGSLDRMVVGGTYTPSLWIKEVTPGNDTAGTIKVYIDPGDGSWDLALTIDRTELSSSYQQFIGTPITAVATTGKIQITATVPSMNNADDWTVEIDDVVLEGESDMAAKRRDIKAAIESRLSVISIANGYNVDLGDVHDSPIKPEDVGTWPASAVLWGRAEFEQGGKAVELQHRMEVSYFPIVLYAKGEDADDELADLVADIQNALEATADNFGLSLGYVREVSAHSIDPVDLGDAAHRGGYWAWAITIKVRWKYNRGSA